jgi:hypothetical protein
MAHIPVKLNHAVALVIRAINQKDTPSSKPSHNVPPPLFRMKKTSTQQFRKLHDCEDKSNYASKPAVYA